MKFANIRDLRINSNAVFRGLSREDVVITNRGKPVAAIIYLDESLLDSYVLAHHPSLLGEIERDVRKWKGGRLKALSLQEVRERLLRRRSRRPRATG